MKEKRALENNMFIATPTHIVKDYCAADFIKAACRYFPTDQIFVLCNSRESMSQFYSVNRVNYLQVHFDDSYYDNYGCIQKRIAESMNILRYIFLKYTPKLDWFISLEADVIVNIRAVHRLCCTLNARPEINVLHTECYHGFQAELAAQEEVVEVQRMTLGFTAIHRSVLEQIEFRYDPNNLVGFHDAWFAGDCMARGIKIFYDPKCVVEHRDSGAYNGRGWQNLSLRERGIV